MIDHEHKKGFKKPTLAEFINALKEAEYQIYLLDKLNDEALLKLENGCSSCSKGQSSAWPASLRG